MPPTCASCSLFQEAVEGAAVGSRKQPAASDSSCNPRPVMLCPTVVRTGVGDPWPPVCLLNHPCRFSSLTLAWAVGLPMGALFQHRKSCACVCTVLYTVLRDAPRALHGIETFPCERLSIVSLQSAAAVCSTTGVQPSARGDQDDSLENERESSRLSGTGEPTAHATELLPAAPATARPLVYLLAA